MTPLEKVEAELLKKQAELGLLQKEITALEQACEILRLLPEDTVSALESTLGVLRRVVGLSEHDGVLIPLPNSAKSTVAGMTITEAAVQILSERPRPRHFGEIASEAIERGYGYGREIDRDKVIGSFAQILRRCSGEDGPFAKAGEGRYVLRKKKEEQIPI